MSTSLLPLEIPSNIYKPTNPFEATVLENTRLTAPDSANEVVHVVFDIAQSDLVYLEGQSIGVLPPGTCPEGKPHKLRLYSIASPAVGDDGQGKTVSLCVKRAVTEIPETGERFEGVCSSYICELKPGDKVKITGPVGKAFLMPDTPNANMIMVGTGTGIAPFRAFVHNRFHKRTNENGVAWVIFGAQTQKDFLYKDEWAAYEKFETFKLTTAFSRETKNAQGGRMYVQHRIAEEGKAILDLLRQPNTYFYICGLKGMETGIFEGLTAACQAEGLIWDDVLNQLKAEKRWHVEVY